MGVARLAGGDSPLVVDLGDGFIAAHKTAQRRNVFTRAVFPDSHGPQLHLLALRSEANLGRGDVEPRQPIGRLGQFRAPLNPTQQDAVLPAVFRKSLAALVQVRIGRLDQDQTAGRLLQVDPRAVLGQQCRVVGLKVIPEQRQLESPATLEGPVTGPSVTAQTAE